MDVSKVKEIIAKHAKVSVDSLNIDADFKNDLHLDSIDLFQIIMEVEEEFGIRIENEQLLGIHTVKDALDKVKNARH